MARQIYGLIGHPVGHSFSPAMQNAAFKSIGIDAEYRLYDVRPGDLADFLRGVPDKKIAGFNVTIPHKIKTKEYLDRSGFLDENARRLGAVNTVKTTDDGRLCGFNTDGPGFYRSLLEDLKFEPEGRNIFVIGAGGAASAVTMYLGNGPRSISIFDIDIARAEDLKRHYAKYYDAGKLIIVTEGRMAKALESSDLLINATPMGMSGEDPSPVDKGLLHARLSVYDLVYNRRATRLTQEAAAKKLHAVTGLGMLLYQGAIALEIWTGKTAPIAVMRKALRGQLNLEQKRRA